MFKKPFKIKSNTQLKASERKNFKDTLCKNFGLTDDEINYFLPKKEVLSLIKIATYDEEIVHVYTVQKRPYIFEKLNVWYPTVYMLWKFPNILYSFTTHPQVINYIVSGADLMLPGVVARPVLPNENKYGSLNENCLAYVNLSNNQAAVAVGTTAQSSFAMSSANGRGKCLTIQHFYGDKLCCLDGMNQLPLPNKGPPDWLSFTNYENDFPELGSKPQESTQNEIAPAPAQPTEPTLEPEDLDSPEQMDKLLEYCFLASLKYSKTLTLPILLSNFFKLQVLPMCPPDRDLDLKKTSYKKLKPFLETMQKIGLITIKEIKKGVEAITDINKDNAKFSEFYISPENRTRDSKEESAKTSITESYIVTQNVVPLFAPDYSKGSTIQGTEVRKLVTKYVKDNNCQDEANPKLVKPNEVLLKICKTKSSITWEELMEKTCEAMKNCFKVSHGNEEIVNKGKVSPITFSVSVRSGNKKVTLVDNLELYGININEFAKECQHGVAASTSVTRPPGKKCDQLLVQGNQIIFINKLLTDKYQIPKKYIRGLENAPKNKK